MTHPILNIDELDYQTWEHGERFSAQLGQIGRRVGAKKLGYNVTILAPGKCAFPFHSHRVNDEMFFIIEGQGELRLGDETHAVRKGDVIATPPGGPETAHQLRNTSDRDELKYLAVSSLQTPEICEYPDSGKYAISGEFPAEGDGDPTNLRFITKQQGTLADYWEGE